MNYSGIVYRAHNPRWSFDPLSGDGAALHGGRFNEPGRSALYLSTTIETAIREAAQGLSGKIDPLTIVSYEADIDDIVDLSSLDACAAADVDRGLIGGAWKLQAAKRERVYTWDVTARLAGEGAAGILVPSFARGARTEHLNLVLWRWSATPPHRLTVHDPDRRLPKDQTSWR